MSDGWSRALCHSASLVRLKDVVVLCEKVRCYRGVVWCCVACGPVLVLVLTAHYDCVTRALWGWWLSLSLSQRSRSRTVTTID